VTCQGWSGELSTRSEAFGTPAGRAWRPLPRHRDQALPSPHRRRPRPSFDDETVRRHL